MPLRFHLCAARSRNLFAPDRGAGAVRRGLGPDGADAEGELVSAAVGLVQLMPTVGAAHATHLWVRRRLFGHGLCIGFCGTGGRMPRAPMSPPAPGIAANSEHVMQIAPSSLLALPLLFQMLAMPAAAQGPT